MVDTQFWQRVQEVFEHAVAASGQERAAILDQECAGDPELRTQVLALLDYDARAGADFLAPPRVELHAIAADATKPLVPGRTSQDHVTRMADAAAWVAELVGSKLGRYTLVRLIATGGMGGVFEARQDQPARAVAVKVLRPGFSAPSALARFRLEPEVLGRLRHPNIAQVFEAGVHADAQGPVPYFAMELISDAEPLNTYADAHQLSTAQRLELFAKVCDAVHHGHQKGIIHRDIKPANILVGRDGEPKIIDFGVARATDADIVMTTLQTHVGELVGTVHYMSPEQCEGDPAAIDTRTDIYSLGVVLFELLTGQAPYDMSGTSVYGAVRIIREQSPRRPSTIDRALRGDLESLLLHTLEKEPARRYASAADLGRDIRHFLAGEPLEARRDSGWYVLRSTVRRYRGIVATGVSIFLLLAIYAVSTTALWRNAQQQADHAAAARAETLRTLYAGSISGALAATANGDHRRATQLLEEAPPEHRGWEWRYLWGRTGQSLENLHPAESRGKTAVVVLSARQQALALARSRADQALEIYRTTPGAEPLEIPWELLGIDQEEARHGHVAVKAIAFHPDAAFLAIGTMHEREPQFKQWVHLLGQDADQYWLRVEWPVRSNTDQPVHLAFDPSGEMLAVTCEKNRAINVFRLSDILDPQVASEDPVPIATATGLAQYSGGVRWSPNGRWLGSWGAGAGRLCELWEVDELLRHGSGDPVARLAGHNHWVWAADFSPDSTRLATASSDGTIRVWDLAASVRAAAAQRSRRVRGKPAEIAVLTGHDGPVCAVAFDPSGRLLLSGGVDKTLRVWSLDVGQITPDGEQQPLLAWSERVVLRGHDAAVYGVGFAPSARAVSVDELGEIKLWDWRESQHVQLRGLRASMHVALFGPGGNWCLAASAYGEIIGWESSDAAPRLHAKLVGRTEKSVQVRDMVMWRQGHRAWLAAALEGPGPPIEPYGEAVIFEVNALRNTWHHHQLADTTGATWQERPTRLALSADGSRLVVMGESGCARVWDLAWNADNDTLESKWLRNLETGQVGNNQLKFVGGGGRWLVTARDAVNKQHDRTTLVYLWDVDRGELEKCFETEGLFESGINDLALCPQGSWLAAAGADGTIALWTIRYEEGRIPELQFRARLEGHTDWVQALAFHPSEPRLVSGGGDRSIRFWDLTSLRSVATLHAPLGAITDLAFDPSGRMLAVGSSGYFGVDNVVYLLDADVTPAERTRRAVTREVYRHYDQWRDDQIAADAASEEQVARIRTAATIDLAALIEAQQWSEEERAWALAVRERILLLRATR